MCFANHKSTDINIYMAESLSIMNNYDLLSLIDRADIDVIHANSVSHTMDLLMFAVQYLVLPFHVCDQCC